MTILTRPPILNLVDLANYYIGTDINASRATLSGMVAGVLGRLDPQPVDPAATSVVFALPLDTLPGITPAKVGALSALAIGYSGINVTQAGAQSQATGTRAFVADRVKAIRDDCITIQLAADVEFPYRNPAIRREFKIPANRPLVE